MPQLPGSLSPSGRYITEQFTAECITAKQARYSAKQFAAAEFTTANLPEYNTTWLTVLAFGTAKHAWSPNGTVPTSFAVVAFCL